MKRIAIVIPYFGSWPKWFDFFLKTCKYNKTIEWILFTDCNIPKNTPDNVHFKEMTIEDFNILASKKTQVEVELENAYKICDFKPAYGKIFEEYLSRYDFWGWGDLDVVYGKLRKIFTPYRLKNYDIISTRRYGTSGVLLILKNSERIKNIYRKSPDYKKVFKSSVGYAFDETGSFFEGRDVVGFTEVVKNQEVNYHFWDYASTDKNIEKEKLDIYWENGSLYDMRYGTEIALYHFLDRKKDNEFSIQKKPISYDKFTIRENGIHEEKSPRVIEKKTVYQLKRKITNGLRWMKDIFT